jgi:hypothetical protein
MTIESVGSTHVASSIKMRPDMLAEPNGEQFAAYLEEQLAELNKPRPVLTPAEQQEAFQQIAAKYDPRAISFWEQEAMTADLRAAGLLPDDPAACNPHPATCLLTPRIAPTVDEAQRLQDLWKTEPRLHEKRNLIVNLSYGQYSPQVEHKYEFLSLMNTIVEYRTHDPILSKIPYKHINVPYTPEDLEPLTPELVDYGKPKGPQAEDPYAVNFTAMALRSSGVTAEEEEDAEEKANEQATLDKAATDKAIADEKAIATAEARMAEAILTATGAGNPPMALKLPDGRQAY